MLKKCSMIHSFERVLNVYFQSKWLKWFAHCIQLAPANAIMEEMRSRQPNISPWVWPVLSYAHSHTPLCSGNCGQCYSYIQQEVVWKPLLLSPPSEILILTLRTTYFLKLLRSFRIVRFLAKFFWLQVLGEGFPNLKKISEVAQNV